MVLFQWFWIPGFCSNTLVFFHGFGTCLAKTCWLGVKGLLSDIPLYFIMNGSIEQFLCIPVVYLVSLVATFQEVIGKANVELSNCLIFLLCEVVSLFVVTQFCVESLETTFKFLEYIGGVIFVCTVFPGEGFQFFYASGLQQVDCLSVLVFLGTFWASIQNSAKAMNSWKALERVGCIPFHSDLGQRSIVCHHL